MATHSSYLALRIPMNRGAWWATVHRITKSRTWLKWLSMHTRTLNPRKPQACFTDLWLYFCFVNRLICTLLKIFYIYLISYDICLCLTYFKKKILSQQCMNLAEESNGSEALTLVSKKFNSYTSKSQPAFPEINPLISLNLLIATSRNLIHHFDLLAINIV